MASLDSAAVVTTRRSWGVFSWPGQTYGWMDGMIDKWKRDMYSWREAPWASVCLVKKWRGWLHSQGTEPPRGPVTYPHYTSTACQTHNYPPSLPAEERAHCSVCVRVSTEVNELVYTKCYRLKEKKQMRYDYHSQPIYKVLYLFLKYFI